MTRQVGGEKEDTAYKGRIVDEFQCAVTRGEEKFAARICKGDAVGLHVLRVGREDLHHASVDAEKRVVLMTLSTASDTPELLYRALKLCRAQHTHLPTNNKLFPIRMPRHAEPLPTDLDPSNKRLAAPRPHIPYTHNAVCANTTQLRLTGRVPRHALRPRQTRRPSRCRWTSRRRTSARRRGRQGDGSRGGGRRREFEFGAVFHARSLGDPDAEDARVGGREEIAEW